MWEKCLNSFLSTSVNFEVVFGGFCSPEEVSPFLIKYPFLRYIKTGNVKPSQVYEITRRGCRGETVIWFCDDAEVPNNVIGKAYKYWRSQNNEKLILSIQTKESGYKLPQGQLFDMKQHGFFGGCPDTPLMAPLGMMSRKFLDDLGGIDRRYVCGQYENDIVMRAYSQGAKVEIFGGEDCYIDIDHVGKSISIGESKDEADFLNRPFAKGFNQDRSILENSWCRFNPNRLQELVNKGRKYITAGEIFDISKTQLDTFEPYAKDISLTESESNKGIWL